MTEQLFPKKATDCLSLRRNSVVCIVTNLSRVCSFIQWDSPKDFKLWWENHLRTLLWTQMLELTPPPKLSDSVALPRNVHFEQSLQNSHPRVLMFRNPVCYRHIGIERVLLLITGMPLSLTVTHVLIHSLKIYWAFIQFSSVAQLCPTLCDPMDSYCKDTVVKKKKISDPLKLRL